jgi:methyltransferase
LRTGAFTMVTWFTGVITFVVIQRLVELRIAKRNALYAKSLGGYEIGKEHYPFIVLLHITFLGSLILETLVKGNLHIQPKSVFLTIFFLAQILRIWVLASLGKMWNTRIFIIPNSQPVTCGPYRYLKHPNYLVVMLEIATLPLAFGALGTAIIFSGLNLVLLKIRIKVEEEGLKQIPSFEEYFKLE